METNDIEEDTPGGVPVKMWTRGVPVEGEARRQLYVQREHYFGEDVFLTRTWPVVP